MAAIIVSAALLPQRLTGTDAAIQQAVADLQHQNYKAAELKLRAELKLHPSDPEALSLLGIALDQQKRLPEAAEFHRRAMAVSPRSTAVLYNYANHLLATGDEKGAREVLLKSVAVDPSDRNSNLALTQMALNRKDGLGALTYLDHIKDAPETVILRLTALDLAGKRQEADALFQQLSAGAQYDARLSAEYGFTLTNAGQFAQAEIFLSHALAADPANFRLLYTLGVAASQAGHNERARGVLETALRQQPKNVDVLYALGVVCNALAQPEQAIRLLAEAGQLDPNRADVQKLIAITARNMKADEDSAAAWGRYLKLVPNDDEAKRERAFEKARLALLDEALPDLHAYVARHPADAMGFYELGMAESVNDPAQAISTLGHAISLQPDLVPARAGRGILLYLENKPESAVTDLEFAVSRIPPDTQESAAMLDRLGETYLALNRLRDAVPALRKAAQLSPNDPTVQLHLANALAEAGETAESDALMARFRQMRPGGRSPKVEGVVDYLSMTPEQRHELYRSRVEKAVHDHPEDINSQILYMKYLLSNGEMAAATAVALKLPSLKPGAAALADAGHVLLAARQYSPAKTLLGQAAVLYSSPGVELDLAIAAFHAAGSPTEAANEGLRQLDGVPESSRRGDYYLARAQMLDAAGRAADAITSIRQGITAEPARPDLYWEAAVLMTNNHRAAELPALLDRAAQQLPDAWQIPVIRAAMLELGGKTDEALRILSEARNRWPEAAAIWVAQGMILAAHDHAEAAAQSLQTGIALGSHSPEAVDPAKLFLTRPPEEW